MSYSTVAEANEYVQTHYLSDSVEADNWDNLSDDDKVVLLNKGFSVIESLPITGRKNSVNQTTAFPRFPFTEVPTAVKYAEIELAVSFADVDESAVAADYRKMIDYGINSYSIGNFSETLLTYSKNSVQVKYGLVSAEAERYLTPWLSGGFRICPP